MEQHLPHFAHANGMSGIYRVRVAEFHETGACEHTVWDKLLGLTTIIVVSAGGWAVVIELIRLLK